MTVLSVDFTAHGQAKRDLEKLEKLPPRPDGGALSVFSDGTTVYILGGDGDEWEVLGRYDHADLIRYLFDRANKRRRTEDRVKQTACEHDWIQETRDRKRCKRCHKRKVREKAWAICGKWQLGTEEDRRAGRAWCYGGVKGPLEFRIHNTICRRREGHKGPCKFSKRDHRR